MFTSGESFSDDVERRLNGCLREMRVPDEQLVEAIGVCKVLAIRSCIEQAHRLQQEVGSYALMANTGMEHLDMLMYVLVLLPLLVLMSMLVLVRVLVLLLMLILLLPQVLQVR